MTVKIENIKQKSFQCDTCGFASNYKATLKTHMRRHTGEKPFSCDKCGHRFSDQSTLISHVRTHTGEHKVACEECGLQVSKKSLKFHLLNKHSNLSSARHYNYSDQVKAEAVQLARRVGRFEAAKMLGIKPLAVRKWTKGITTFLAGEKTRAKVAKINYSEDYKRQVAENALKFSIKETAKTFQLPEVNVRTWLNLYHNAVTCEDCGATFPYQSQLKKHMTRHHGKSFTKEQEHLDSNIKVKVEEAKRTLCEVSLKDKTVKIEVADNSNAARKTEWECDQVEFKEINKTHKEEQYIHHGPTLAFVMGMSAITLISLFCLSIRWHMKCQLWKKIHRQEKKPKKSCEKENIDEGGKDLQEDNVDIKMQSILDESDQCVQENEKKPRVGQKQGPVTCEKCGSIFAHRHSLMGHLPKCEAIQERKGSQKERKPMVQGPATCDKCGFIFAHRPSMLRHLKKCESGILKAKSTLSTKMESAFQTCYICGKSWNKRSNLLEHLKRHKKILEFHCSACGNDFFNKRALKVHTEKYHPMLMDQFESKPTRECELCKDLFFTIREVRQHKVDRHGQYGHEYPFINT